MRRIAVIAAGIALITPGAALGQDARACPSGSSPECYVATNAAGTDEGFPFTLLDLGLLAAGAGIALAAGVTLRRASAGDPYVAPRPVPEPEPFPVSPQPALVSVDLQPALVQVDLQAPGQRVPVPQVAGH